MGDLRETFRMRKTSIAENWSAVEELRTVISRVGEERRTLESQLAKVFLLTNTLDIEMLRPSLTIFGTVPQSSRYKLYKKTLFITAHPQLMEDRSAMAKSVEEQGLRMVHLEKEGRQLEREVWGWG